MQVNVGLAVRNPAQLDDLIAAASTPGSPSYGRYLTQEEYLADFAPTDASVAAARAWLASNGLTVTNVSPDNLIIGVEGSVSKIEGAFGVSIESFHYGSRSFYANTANPTVPSNLSITWVGGLNDAAVIEAAHSSDHPASGYSPNDLRKAYNVSGAGTGQSIGFTLWGAAIPQSDFNGYASHTATTAIKVGQAGADGLDWVQVDGASSTRAPPGRSPSTPRSPTESRREAISPTGSHTTTPSRASRTPSMQQRTRPSRSSRTAGAAPAPASTRSWRARFSTARRPARRSTSRPVTRARTSGPSSRPTASTRSPSAARPSAPTPRGPGRPRTAGGTDRSATRAPAAAAPPPSPARPGRSASAPRPARDARSRTSRQTPTPQPAPTSSSAA